MATVEDLYSDLEDVPFPESEIKELLGELGLALGTKLPPNFPRNRQ